MPPLMTKILPAMKVGEVLERYPGTLPVFLQFGFAPLKDPALRLLLGRRTTIAMGAAHHGVEVKALVNALNEVIEQEGAATPPETPHAETARRLAAMSLGELVARWPATRGVVRRHFGATCFECPAFGRDTVAFACGLHNADVSTFVDECRHEMRETLLRLPVMMVASRFPASVPLLHEADLLAWSGGEQPLRQAIQAQEADEARVVGQLLDAIVRPSPTALPEDPG